MRCYWARVVSTFKASEIQERKTNNESRSLVDALTYKMASENADAVTASAILGPFYRKDHPVRENGSSMVLSMPKDGQLAFMHGRVTDGKTGKPIRNAAIDLWQASTNGM